MISNEVGKYGELAKLMCFGVAIVIFMVVALMLPFFVIEFFTDDPLIGLGVYFIEAFVIVMLVLTPPILISCCCKKRPRGEEDDEVELI